MALFANATSGHLHRQKLGIAQFTILKERLGQTGRHPSQEKVVWRF